MVWSVVERDLPNLKRRWKLFYKHYPN
ncbi:hypothetical protein QUB80_10055 [Chlorogloeopsis sp. ULAP01]|nr:hypothetical protein [Chlorogloeopsis sp. ULAP01]MDM9381046.1 hypothetical protein [Chlorogloeopsis sp. ULAP01]